MKKILLAEDEENVVKVLKMVLVGAGYQVTVAKDGQEALDIIKQNPPDAVITDLSMPNIDGGKLCRIIKESPHFSKIKVIICSALSSQSLQEKFTLPADGYLMKPVDVNVLVDMVNGLFPEESPA